MSTPTDKSKKLLIPSKQIPVGSRSFLFCSLASQGFLYPAIGLALCLKSRGHKVAFVSDISTTSTLQSVGLRRLPRGHPDGSSYDPSYWHVPEAGAIQLLHVRHALDLFPADILVGSELGTGHLLAGEMEDLPTATLGMAAYLWPRDRRDIENATQSSIEGLRSFRFRGRLNAFNHVRTLLGLEPMDADPLYANPFLTDLYLLRSVPELEPNVEELDARICLVGDCLWEEPEPSNPTLDRWISRALDHNQPIIYVHQGRSFGWDSFWRPFTEVASRIGATFIVDTGRMDQDVGDLPVNVHAAPHVPLRTALRDASAVISSANTTSVLGALTHGLPSLLVPVGGEQPELAHRCKIAGVSYCLQPDRLGCEVLQLAIEALLENVSLGERSRKIASTFRAYRESELPVSLLEAMASGWRVSTDFARSDRGLSGPDRAPV
jgi:UDP:flavonoid glycosyltransferase YjiC (YdhE family)